jgi:hypothetical protein
MDENFDIVFGMRHGWGLDSTFGLSAVDRRHHAYIIGKTGSGKSTLLKNLLIQDIEADHGVGVIDPHGDLARDLLDFIPCRRAKDVAYFDPAISNTRSDSIFLAPKTIRTLLLQESAPLLRHCDASRGRPASNTFFTPPSLRL